MASDPAPLISAEKNVYLMGNLTLNLITLNQTSGHNYGGYSIQLKIKKTEWDEWETDITTQNYDDDAVFLYWEYFTNSSMKSYFPLISTVADSNL